MSQIDINNLLSQMRDIRAQLDPSVRVGPAVGKTQDKAVDSFGDLLKQSVADVNQSEHQAAELSTRFERGDPDTSLPQVMLAVEKANLSFHGLTAVRNKLVQAYTDIMNMPV